MMAIMIDILLKRTKNKKQVTYLPWVVCKAKKPISFKDSPANFSAFWGV